MARKLRLEYENARYHVINRGNYRADIFKTQGAKLAFERCLFEACEKSGWILHAYVVMRNHYHLALQTPGANLVAGMKWLQATYANRFNRLRKEQGHVFQGRYQAIVVEDGPALGAIGHYLHLNPVRAKAVPLSALATYRFSSLHWLDQPRQRPSCLDFSTVLETAGGLGDTPAGRQRYREYLAWLAEDEPARKALRFESMSRGWVYGSKSFKQALVKEHKQVKAIRGALDKDAAEARELAWDDAVERCLRRLRRPAADVPTTRKSAPWKVAIAAQLKATSTVSNPWLAQRLHMGDPDGVSRYCAECRAGARPEAAALLAKITDIRV
jgi:REP element-mobilizing transposase RayT